MAILFGEVFGGVGANPPDLQALANQHARTALRGLLMPGTGRPPKLYPSVRRAALSDGARGFRARVHRRTVDPRPPVIGNLAG